jgi:hypothetical protein
VAEGAANGTAVGITASATDPNGPAVTYSLTDDAGGRFAIDSSTGVVTVADSTLLNFESATSHTITVQASDGAGGTSTANFTVSVTNVNPSTPIDNDAAANSVAEGAANGTAVGVTASATDPNGPAVTYSLTDDAGGRFVINPTTGVVTVANGSLLDYETATSHTITVQASDGAGGTATANFTIQVTNVLEFDHLDVQHGATQRSYVRYLDLFFADQTGLNDLLQPNRIKLTKADLNGNNPVPVSLTGALTASAGKVSVDFGANGIGGDRNSTAGDGYYEISIDLDGNGSYDVSQHFYRLFGDVNGDRTVNTSDFNQILAAFGTTGTNLEADANGDGTVNALDRTLAIRSNGKLLSGSLPLDD